MRGLLYVRSHFEDPANQGVANKYKGIQKALGALNIEADLVSYGRAGLLLNGRPLRHLPFGARKKSLGHIALFFFFSEWYLWRSVDLKAYDFILIRHFPTHWFFLLFLRAIKKKHPGLRIVLEFPTWPYDAEMNKTLLLRIDKLFRGRLHRYVDNAFHYGAETSIWGIPALPLRNGIGMDQTVMRPEKANTDGQIRLLFIGSVCFWHGLDRLLKGMADVKQSKKVSLDIVGKGPALAQLIELCHSLSLKGSVKFHAPVTGSKLDEFFENADMAIGSLAMHRIGLETATPLKHREYCARGLRFCLACDDPDFPSGTPFVLQVPATDAPIDLAGLVYFAQQNNPACGSHMRDYAANKLSWKAVLAPYFTQ